MTENTITVSLSKPIEHSGKTYESLTFRKLKSRDVVAAEAADGEFCQTLALLSSMAGVPIGVLMETEIQEVMNVAKAIEPLLAAAEAAATNTAAA